MYLKGYDGQPPYLGDPITGALTAVSAVGILKNLFGIGKKKKALAQIQANAQGKWTSQLPPYADWDEWLSRPATNPKAKAAGAKTFLDEYNFWKGRKDSILIKNQIATPQDYAAWLVITYGLKDGWINPNAKPGDPLYRMGPLALETNIPIFDYAAIDAWAKAQFPKQVIAAGPRGTSPTSTPQPTMPPQPAKPATPLPPKATNIAPLPIPPKTVTPPTAPPDVSFFPDAQSVATPVPLVSPPQSAPGVATASFPPIVAIGLAGALVLFAARKRKGR